MSIQASNEGDPGKLAWFRNPNWQTKFPLEGGGMKVDPRLCPGCLFPHAIRPAAHVQDARCKLWKEANV